jgi:hypothetical protein
MPKVVFLSHSSAENLTRDWDNTTPLAAPATHCPGRGDNEAPACHQLHYNWSNCQQAKDAEGNLMGVAQCQAEITADDAYNVIAPIIRKALQT